MNAHIGLNQQMRRLAQSVSAPGAEKQYSTSEPEDCGLLAAMVTCIAVMLVACEMVADGVVFGGDDTDLLLTVGNEIVEATMSYRSRWFEYLCYRPLLKQYFKDDRSMRWVAAPKPRLTERSYKARKNSMP